MALTINTHTAKSVVNAPAFKVTTSLVEGASYNNLRIRATIYVGGKDTPVAVLEQPKGLSAWDFSGLLTTFIGRMDAAVGGSTLHKQPTLSAELLTAWTQLNLETFTTAGRTVSAAIQEENDPAYIVSNDLGAVSVGDVVVIGVANDFVDNGENRIFLSFGTSAAIIEELSYAELEANKVYFHVVSVDNATPTVRIGSSGGEVDFVVTASIKTVSDFIGNAALYFKVKYEEVYENASNITTIGAEEITTSLLYVPVAIPVGETFNGDYLMAGSADKFLNASLRAGTKHLVGSNMEHRIMYATDECYVRSYEFRGGFGAVVLNAGYGFIIVNDNTLNSLVLDTFIEVRGYRGATSVQISESLPIVLDLKCQNTKVLSFKGDLGDETFIFTGEDNKTYLAEKEFYKTSSGQRKPLSSKRQTQKVLTTGYLSLALKELLLQLIDTIEEVWLLDTDAENNYQNATVLTSKVEIIEGESLIEHQILVEYHE